MRLPQIHGVIDRRILVNFRVDPDALQRLLPAPFQPQLVNGYGIAGICLIRLTQMRPSGLPAWLGLKSENAAHRIAVQWPTAEGPRSGVYVPRRDTSSRLNVLAGRVFPSAQHLARFEVRETATTFHVAMTSRDGAASVSVDASLTDHLPADSVFDSVEQVSQFFREGSLGYSPGASPEGRRSQFDGIELVTPTWQVEPLAVTDVHSSFFTNEADFPSGSVCFDNALLMRQINHTWKSRPPLCCLEERERESVA